MPEQVRSAERPSELCERLDRLVMCEFFFCHFDVLWHREPISNQYHQRGARSIATEEELPNAQPLMLKLFIERVSSSALCMFLRLCHQDRVREMR